MDRGNGDGVQSGDTEVERGKQGVGRTEIVTREYLVGNKTVSKRFCFEPIQRRMNFRKL